MPFVQTQDEVLPDVLHLPEETQGAERVPSFMDETIPAAFRQQNSVVSAYNFLSGDHSQGEASPGYDPFSDIKGYESSARAFVSANTPMDVARIKNQLDREKQDRETIAAAGWPGMAASFSAGLFDPLIMVPIGAELKVGESALKTGLATARAAALGLTADEALLQATQAGRPIEESVSNIAMGTFLSGLLGGAVGKLTGIAPEMENQIKIPEGADPLTPGFIRITPEELASDTNGSVGAAQTNTSNAKLKGALGAEKVLRQTAPMLRLSTSGEVETRRVTQDLLETPYIYEDNALGNTPAPAVETLVKAYQAPLAESIQNLDAAYVKYRTGQEGGRLARLKAQASDALSRNRDYMTFSEFKEAVGMAMRRGDASDITEVAEAARNIRKKVFDPLKDGAIETGLLPKDVQVTTAASYLSRLWNLNKIIAKRPEFLDITTRWLKQQRDLASRGAGEASDDFSRLSDAELKDVSDQIYERLVGAPGGRISYEAIPVALKTAPGLKERTFNIPDALVEDFLESDVERVMHHYVRTMAPDVELARRFVTADMAESLKKIKDAYARKADAATSDRARIKLNAQRDADIRDVSAMRDRLRGTYAAPTNPNSLLSRSVHLIKDWNYLRLMGGMVISSFADAARPVMAEGINRVVGAGLVPMIRNLKAFRLAGAEVKKAGTALDMVMGSRAMSLSDLGDDFGRNSKFERGLNAAAQVFGTAALMNPWNTALKQFTGVIIQDRILQHVASWAEGKLGAAGIERMASARIDRNMAERIARQFADHGETVDGTRIANTDDWTDPYARQAYRAAILKEVDHAIVTPGIGDKPLVASKLLGSPELAQLIFQFRSFTFASTQRILVSGLQRRDMATLNGLLLSVSLGALTYYVKTLQAGLEPSDDPLVWLSEGVDRSGVTGSLYDINNIVEKLTRGQVGVNALRGGPPMSRYASRNLTGALLGPSLGTLQDVGTTTGAIAQGEASEADKRAMLRLIPAQNLFYLRSLLDKAAEDSSPQ